MYTVFTRNWWKIENGKKVPSPHARKTVLRRNIKDIAEARKICKEYNDTPASRNSKLSRKAEFTSNF